jgi:hypothetical protein
MLRWVFTDQTLTDIVIQLKWHSNRLKSSGVSADLSVMFLRSNNYKRLNFHESETAQRTFSKLSTKQHCRWQLVYGFDLKFSKGTLWMPAIQWLNNAETVFYAVAIGMWFAAASVSDKTELDRLVTQCSSAQWVVTVPFICSISMVATVKSESACSINYLALGIIYGRLMIMLLRQTYHIHAQQCKAVLRTTSLSYGNMQTQILTTCAAGTTNTIRLKILRICDEFDWYRFAGRRSTPNIGELHACLPFWSSTRPRTSLIIRSLYAMAQTMRLGKRKCLWK